MLESARGWFTKSEIAVQNLNHHERPESQISDILKYKLYCILFIFYKITWRKADIKQKCLLHVNVTATQLLVTWILSPYCCLPFEQPRHGFRCSTRKWKKWFHRSGLHQHPSRMCWSSPSPQPLGCHWWHLPSCKLCLNQFWMNLESLCKSVAESFPPVIVAGTCFPQILSCKAAKSSWGSHIWYFPAVAAGFRGIRKGFSPVTFSLFKSLTLIGGTKLEPQKRFSEQETNGQDTISTKQTSLHSL